MRRYSQRQNLSTLSEINITPLLDLAFVLLIIFMITTPLLESSMNLVIPSSGTMNLPINTSHVQTVSIDRTDTIRFGNQVMDLETLTTQLVQLKEMNPEIAIVIRPDRDLPVQKLIGVMDAFTGVAEAGSPNLVAMAPGVSGALITTVTALCVAIPAMFGYNFLVTSIRGIIVEMDNFAAELASEFEHKYVDHGSRESVFRR